jgi:hypothetical protein
MERIATGLKHYSKALATVCIIFGFLTVLPWSTSKPNHVSYHSVCSFAPISTVVLFAMAATFYSFGKGMMRSCYIGMTALIIIFSFSGYWAYSIKLPVDSVQVSMTIDYFWCGYDDHFKDNVSSIFLNLTLKNPTCQDTPTLRIENYNFFINSKKLRLSTYDSSSTGGYAGIRYIHPTLTIKANQTLTYSEIHIILKKNYTEIEGNDKESVWAAFIQGNFNVTLTGVLVGRTDFGNIETDHPPSKLILVAKPLTLSCTYPP